MEILVCNVGTTSLKFKLFSLPSEQLRCEARIERVGTDDAIYQYKNTASGWTSRKDAVPVRTYVEGIRLFLADMTDEEHGVLSSIDRIEGVGFKTVLAKGFDGVFELTEEVIGGLRDYLFIAPAHNGPYLSAIDQFRQLLPETPMIGVFETAFHRTIPLANRMYAIPYEWYEKYGIVRKGYHGASFSYIAQKAAEDGDYRRVIGCHLGGSSSVCAILDGESFDTSFGFSLQTGLPHANRCGDVDAYLVPFLENEGLSQEEILSGLSKNGGLKGISGVSNDMREIKEAADRGNARAQLAIDVFVQSLVRTIGGFYAELGGLDKLVFSGGIGENAGFLRQRVCRALAHLGVILDEAANAALPPDGTISAADSPVRVQVIPANEELGVALQTYQHLRENGSDETR